MEEGLLASIFPVESSQQDNNEFGTGFIICQDRSVTYFLTCAHVVDIVGKDYIQIDGMTATVKAMGASDNLDLAILCITESSMQSALDLLITGQEGDSITIIGIHDYDKHRSRKPIRGHLGKQSSLKKAKTKGGWIKAWDLIMETDGFLQRGYSGSPVIHNISGKVLGIVSHRRGQGEKGLAISIEALSELWQLDMPMGLLPTEVESLKKKDDWADSKQVPVYDIETEHIQKKIIGLERSWARINEKIVGLEDVKVYETRLEEIERLSHIIEMTKKQQTEIEAEINALVGRLQKPDTKSRQDEHH